jgi:hypothetical protein
LTGHAALSVARVCGICNSDKAITDVTHLEREIPVMIPGGSKGMHETDAKIREEDLQYRVRQSVLLIMLRAPPVYE